MSRAKVLRPTDTLARLANYIIRERGPSGIGFMTEELCESYAERARLIAVGFYQRNLQHRFDQRMKTQA